MDTTMLARSSLSANTYNPNEMSDDEFAELVAEVRHLGRLPKPVVVRRHGEGYLIVDGEHGWRAAKEVGLTEVVCEVIDVDDFEAMRQTFKRNQHGTHDPVRLGRMFQRMKTTRRLSQRRLAKAVGVSEGTIRNAMVYAEAADLRIHYAQAQEDTVDNGQSEMSRLSVRQVRHYVGLPRTIADLWLNAGADVRALWEGMNAGDQTDADVKEREWELPSHLYELYEALEDHELIAFLPTPRSAGGFVTAMKTLTKWKRWENGFCRQGLVVSDLRPYTRHCFDEAWPVRDTWLMESALNVLIDTSTTPPTFALTPDEFAHAVAQSTTTGEAALDFQPRLRLRIREKTGKLPQDTESVKSRLLESEIQDGAPAYIRESALDPAEKHALWQASGWSSATTDDISGPSLEDAKRALAQTSWIERNRGESLDKAVARHLNTYRREERLSRQWTLTTQADLAQDIAGQMGLYDKVQEADALAALTEKLAALAKPELLLLSNCMEHLAHVGMMSAMIKALQAGQRSVSSESPELI